MAAGNLTDWLELASDRSTVPESAGFAKTIRQILRDWPGPQEMDCIWVVSVDGVGVGVGVGVAVVDCFCFASPDWVCVAAVTTRD